MRTHSLAQLLDYEAKRRPEIAEIMTRVASMTDAEIDALNLPLPWFRKALREERDRLSNLSMTSGVYAHTIFGETDNQEGVIWQWTADATFVPVGKGAIEIKIGDLILITEQGFWFGASLHPPCPIDITQRCRRIGPSTYQDYRLKYRENVSSKLTPVVSRQELIRITRG